MFLRAYCFVNVLTLSCLGSLWFSTLPYYSLNLYVNLHSFLSIRAVKSELRLAVLKVFMIFMLLLFSPEFLKNFYNDL